MSEQLLLTLIPYVVPFILAMAFAFGKLLLERLPSKQREEAYELITAAVTAANHMSPGDEAAAEALAQQVISAAHLNIAPAVIQAFTHSALTGLPEADSVSPPVGFQPPAVLPTPQ